jgi:hypothetical protein
MAMGRVDQLSGFRQADFCRNERPMFYEQVSTEVGAFVLQAETEVVASWPRSPLLAAVITVSPTATSHTMIAQRSHGKCIRQLQCLSFSRVPFNSTILRSQKREWLRCSHTASYRGKLSTTNRPRMLERTPLRQLFCEAIVSVDFTPG